MVTCVLWIVGFIPKSSPECCSASTGSAAAAPGQGSQEYIKKISSHKEKVCREDLDGETGPRDISKLEAKKETADFLVGKNRSSPLSGWFSSSYTKESRVASGPESWLWALRVYTLTCVDSHSILGARRSQTLLYKGA